MFWVKLLVKLEQKYLLQMDVFDMNMYRAVITDTAPGELLPACFRYLFTLTHLILVINLLSSPDKLQLFDNELIIRMKDCLVMIYLQQQTKGSQLNSQSRGSQVSCQRVMLHPDRRSGWRQRRARCPAAAAHPGIHRSASAACREDTRQYSHFILCTCTCC